MAARDIGLGEEKGVAGLLDDAFIPSRFLEAKHREVVLLHEQRCPLQWAAAFRSLCTHCTNVVCAYCDSFRFTPVPLRSSIVGMWPRSGFVASSSLRAQARVVILGITCWASEESSGPSATDIRLVSDRVLSVVGVAAPAGWC